MLGRARFLTICNLLKQDSYAQSNRLYLILQSTLALRTPRYYGHSLLRTKFRSHLFRSHLAITDTKRRPEGVRYNDSSLYFCLQAGHWIIFPLKHFMGVQIKYLQVHQNVVTLKLDEWARAHVSPIYTNDMTCLKDKKKKCLLRKMGMSSVVRKEMLSNPLFVIIVRR